MNYNKVIQSGHVTRDPEVRNIPGGKKVASFGLAVNHGTGDRQEVVFWDVTCWEKTAELVGQYVKKGSGVLVEGRAKTEEWTDKQTNAKRSKIVIVAERVVFGPKAAGAAPVSGQSAAPAGSAPAGDPNDDLPF